MPEPDGLFYGRARRAPHPASAFPTRRARRLRPRVPAAALVLLALVAFGAPFVASARATAVRPTGYAPFGALLLEGRIAAEQARLVGEYALDVRFDPVRRTVAGTGTLRYRNWSRDSLDEIVFALPLNEPIRALGATTVTAVAVAGVPLLDPAAGLSARDTVLRVPLSAPLAPGAVVAVELRFVSVFEPSKRPSRGPGDCLGEDAETGIWCLKDWYPAPAPYDADDGWLATPPVVASGRGAEDVLLFDVSVTAPPDLRLVTTGGLAEEAPFGGHTRRRYAAGPVPAFEIVVASGLVAVQGRVGRTIVRVHALPADAEMADVALAAARRTLGGFSRRFGAYPWAELDLVLVPAIPDSASSTSGLIYLGDPVAGSGPDPAPSVRYGTEFLTAHEVAHQWFANGVRNDYVAHGYVGEGLAQLLAALDVAGDHDLGAARTVRLLDAALATPYLDHLDKWGDRAADRTGRMDLGVAREPILYGKAPLGFLAVRETVGADAFDAGLRAYATDHAFGVGTPADLQAAFERASGEDLDALWAFWFVSEDVTERHVRALVDGL